MVNNGFALWVAMKSVVPSCIHLVIIFTTLRISVVYSVTEFHTIPVVSLHNLVLCSSPLHIFHFW